MSRAADPGCRLAVRTVRFPARSKSTEMCRTIALFRSQLEEQRAFQNENVAVTGAAQPEENALEPVLDEDQGEIHVALARQVRELLADGSGEVLWGRFGQLE